MLSLVVNASAVQVKSRGFETRREQEKFQTIKTAKIGIKQDGAKYVMKCLGSNPVDGNNSSVNEKTETKQREKRQKWRKTAAFAHTMLDSRSYKNN